MPVSMVIVYLIVFVMGALFRSFLRGPLGMITAILICFVSGFLFSYFSSFIFLAFGIGIMGRAIIGLYWLCLVLEGLALLIGFFIGYSIV